MEMSGKTGHPSLGKRGGGGEVTHRGAVDEVEIVEKMYCM
jgi:hypothetical protein